MKNGWLVVNHFLNANKFSEIYAWLANAAKKNAIHLSLKTNAELAAGNDTGGNPHFVLFWDKDVRLAKLLEAEGMRLFNSADAIEVCDDKALTYIKLKNHVKQPKTVIAPKTFEGIGFHDLGFVTKAETKLGYPMVIKECFGSFGQQVFLAENNEQACSLIRSFQSRPFIMQALISSSFGRDIRMNIVGGRVVSAMLRRNLNGDFRSNLTLGGNATPFEPDADQIEAALKACRVIGLDFAGVDMLLGENGEPIVCEVNSNAHFKTTYDCTGVNMAEEILDYINRQI